MANKSIKGLTVEIGGDTTKLGKALENVDKKSRDLSGELREINKLLKMDPGNADLIAQKQKVLAEAVSNTSDRLETLKNAEKQVQEQFERGEVSEEQVRALQREIIKTERTMDGYTKAAKETTENVEELADASDKAEKSSGGLGKALASAAKAGLAAVGAAAGAAVTGLIAAAESTRDYRTEMGKLDTAFTQNGFSSEAATGAYKEMVGILGETDQSVEAVNHLAKLTETEEELATWTGDILPGVFATFGASLPIEGLTEAANETAKVGQVTGPLADALNWAGVSEDAFNASLAACTTEQERQALITETLAGLYGEASAAYKEANEEVIRANLANEEWMASLAGVGGAIEPIITDVKMLGASLLSEMVPGVQTLAGSLRELLDGNTAAAADVGAALSGIITTILNKVTELAPAIVEVGMALITSLTTTLISMMPQLVTTVVQLVTTILNALTTALPQITQAIVDMIPQLVQALVTGIPQLIEGAVQFLLAILQAIPLIIPPLVEAIPQIVMALVNGLVAALPQLIQGAVQFLLAIVQAIPLLIEQLVPQIPPIITTIVDSLVNNIPLLLDGAVQLLHAIVDAIPLIIEAIMPQIPVIVDAITTGLAQMAPVLLGAAVTLLWEIIKAIPKIVAGLLKNLPSILKAILSVLGSLPSLIGKIFSNVMKKVGEWVSNMVSKAKEAGTKFINNVVNFFKQLPGKIWTFLSNVISRVASWATSLAAKGKAAATKLVTTVVNNIKALPEKIKTIGKNLVQGLWNGINNAKEWIMGKIKSFASSITDGIKSFFGIKSPSRVFRDQVGKMLVEGLAVGVEQNAYKATEAVTDVSQAALDTAKAKATGYSDLGKQYVENLKAGVETNKETAVREMTRLVDDQFAAFKDENGKLASEYASVAKDIVTEYSKALDEGLDEAMKNVETKITGITEKFQKQQDDIIKEQGSMESLLGGGSLFNFGTLTVDGEEFDRVIVSDLDEEIEALQKYDELMTALRSRDGVTDGVLDEVTSLKMDEAIKVAEHLLQMTDEDFTALNDKWTEKQETAKAAAARFYADQLTALDENFNQELNTALADIPETLKNIGKDSMQGWLDGMNSMLPDLNATAASIAQSMMDTIKAELDINSPSRKFAWIGEQVDRGLSAGIIDNAYNPLQALKQLSAQLLGVAENSMNGLAAAQQFGQFRPVAATASPLGEGLTDRLDKILTAIEAGKVIALDGDTLVGATVDRFDNALGQRRALAARGAR